MLMFNSLLLVIYFYYLFIKLYNFWVKKLSKSYTIFSVYKNIFSKRFLKMFFKKHSNNYE